MYLKIFAPCSIILALCCAVWAINPEQVKLYLHDEINFKGKESELQFSSCQPIPLKLVNKVLSVRTEHCIILYEDENCGSDGSTIRLSPAAPTRNNLRQSEFSLGSAKPCSPIPSFLVSNKHGTSVNVHENVGDSGELEDDSHSARNGSSIMEILDYGERVDTDNESDDEDLDAPDPYFVSSSQRSAQSSQSQPTVNSSSIEHVETSSSSTAVQNLSIPTSTTTESSKVLIQDEVPFPSETQDKLRKPSDDSSIEFIEDEVPLRREAHIEEKPEQSTKNSYRISNESMYAHENLPISTASTEVEETSLKKYGEFTRNNSILDVGRESDLIKEISTEFPIIKPSADTEATVKVKTTTRPARTVSTSTILPATSTTTTTLPTKSTARNTGTTTSTTTTNVSPTITPITTTESVHHEGDCTTKMCKSFDEYGLSWEVCASFIGTQNCPGNSTGLVYWECLDNGTFNHSQPNYNNCSTAWIDKFDKLKLEDDPKQAERILSEILDRITSPGPEQPFPGNKTDETIYFGHEIFRIVNLVDATVQKSSAFVSGIQQYETICEKGINVLGSLLSQEKAWEQLDQTNRSTIASHLLDSVETTMFSLGRIAELNSLNKMRNLYERMFEESPVIKILTGVFKKESVEQQSMDVSSVKNTLQILQTTIDLPNGWENRIVGESVRFVGLTLDYEYSAQLLPATNNRLGYSNSLVLASELVAMSIANGSSDKAARVTFEDQGAQITFNIRDRSMNAGKSVKKRARNLPGKLICVYWDPKNLIWSPDGCRLVESSGNTAICECQHLTLFAVLMDVHGLNTVNDAGLTSLTIVLCTLSSICLLITIITLKILRSAKSPSTSITIQLCACLLIGNILILTVLDRSIFKLSDLQCSIAALVLHYFLLCAFVWMAIEGFIVLKMVLDVFDNGTQNKLILGGIAYGLPFTVVCTLSVLHFMRLQNIYGDEMFCWLEGFYILAFVAPVILVVLGNGVALAVAIRVAYKADKRYTEQIKKKVKSFRTWIIGTSALTSILGLTWIFGFLLLIGDPKFSKIASYLFTIFNASQGIFVFIFQCLLNTKMRAAFKQRFMNKSKVSETSRTDSRGIKSGSISADTSGRRITELTSTEKKNEINIHIEKDESGDEIEPRRRFLRSRSNSDEFSRKPAFLKYMDQNQGRKRPSDTGFM